MPKVSVYIRPTTGNRTPKRSNEGSTLIANTSSSAEHLRTGCFQPVESNAELSDGISTPYFA